MCEYADITLASQIMRDGFIGPDELTKTGLFNTSYEHIPFIPFTKEQIEDRANDYLLILGLSEFSDGSAVSIRNLINRFGKDPSLSEPCFYNQDWYDKEQFIDNVMENKWFFIRKRVYTESRSVQPDELMMTYVFPSAISCTYAFFVSWLSRGTTLWAEDFVWCRDTDHNGDRIYVGKYRDIDGVNKNGFSIHRHLSLRPCYGCID